MNSVLLGRVMACALLGATFVSSAEAAPKIGILFKGKSGFWDSMEKGAVEAGQKLGAEILVKTPATENDISIQIQLLNALANQGIDALVIAPSSKDPLLAPIKALADKGVKIVIVDSTLGPGAPGVFVGSNQHAAGEIAGKFLGSLMTPGEEVSVLRHNQTSSATMDREQGAIEALRSAHPTLVLHGDVYASTDKGVEVDRAALIFDKYPKTKGIIVSGSPGTFAMIKVLRERKISGTKFVGFGYNLTPAAVEALEDGTLQGWVAQLPHRIGSQAVEEAIALIKGEKVPATNYTPVVIVTKNNLKEPEIQALLSE